MSCTAPSSPICTSRTTAPSICCARASWGYFGSTRWIRRVAELFVDRSAAGRDARAEGCSDGGNREITLPSLVTSNPPLDPSFAGSFDETVNGTAALSAATAASVPRSAFVADESGGGDIGFGDIAEALWPAPPRHPSARPNKIATKITIALRMYVQS